MALLGMFNVHRHGAINSAAILLYALTCCISGYVSSHFYRQIGGERWVWNIILTSSLFSGENTPCYWVCLDLVTKNTSWVQGQNHSAGAIRRRL
jgi:hypothetical protein